MAKYNSGNFYQVNKENHKNLFSCQSLNTSDRVLYFALLKLENELTNKSRLFFYRAISDLMNDTKLSNKTIIAGLKRLSENNFIRKWRKPKTRKGSDKNTKETITFIRVL